MISPKKIDQLIEAAYYRQCSGIPIDVMDISKVFREGRRAYAAGENIETAVYAFVQTIKKQEVSA